MQAKIKSHNKHLEKAEGQLEQGGRRRHPYQNAEIYTLLFENTGDAIFWADVETGLIINCNKAAEILLDKDKSEIIGSHQSTLHPLHMAGHYSQMFRSHTEGKGVTDAESEVVTKSGQTKYVLISTSIITIYGQKIAQGIFRDITQRKLAEEMLRRSEEAYRLHFENVSDVSFSYDREFRILSVSPSVKNLLGYSPEELIGRTFTELNILAPESMELALSNALRLLAGETVGICEYVFIDKDGSRRYGELSGGAVFSPDGKVVSAVSVARDITERKRLEEELRQRERDYSMLLESTHEGIIVFDVETLKVVFGNRRAALMFGFDPVLRDAIGISVLNQVHPEDREVVLKGLAEDLHASERRKRYEVRVNSKDGKEIWVSALATRIEFQGRLAVLLSLKDISDQKRAEEALKEYREDYAKLVENLSDAVFKFKDGIVVWCNDKVKEIYGYSKDELIGKDASFFIPVDRDPLEFIKSVYAVMKKNGCYRGLAKAKTKGGGTVDIEYSISQIPNKHHIELVTVARDITERRRLEEQIQLAGRLAAVGELAAGVAHELNNPLAAIQGLAQLLTQSNDLSETISKDLNTVYIEAKRAAKITQNLLSFARKHKPERQLISINEALEKILELRAHQMKVNNIELWAQLQPILPMTMADFYQMQQVFMNIIINAEQAMIEAHGRGRLLVETRKVDGVIQITFTDDGPGILEENLKRIFDPFFTTKEPGKGTGLGLSICYGIVKAHAGQIHVRSKPGEGATFVVEIPIVSPDGPSR